MANVMNPAWILGGLNDIVTGESGKAAPCQLSLIGWFFSSWRAGEWGGAGSGFSSIQGMDRDAQILPFSAAAATRLENNMTSLWKKGPPVQLRRAELPDLAEIADIYNEAIMSTTATFDMEPKDGAERVQWFQSHDERHPIIVAVIDEKVVGWASLSRWSERRAYDLTAETSSYVKAEHRGKGIGRKLKEVMIEEARRLGFHTLIARVVEGNEMSLHLNERFGFVHIGTMKEVGLKFGRLLDVQILQKMLK